MSEGRPLFLVDAYNFLHAVLLRGRDRENFWTKERVRELVGYFDDRREAFRLVLDSRAVDEAPEIVRPWLVRAPDADAKILLLVDEYGQRHREANLVVVTADRSLADRARFRGASIESPWDFAARAVSEDQ